MNSDGKWPRAKNRDLQGGKSGCTSDTRNTVCRTTVPSENVTSVSITSTGDSLQQETKSSQPSSFTRPTDRAGGTAKIDELTQSIKKIDISFEEKRKIHEQNERRLLDRDMPSTSKSSASWTVYASGNYDESASCLHKHKEIVMTMSSNSMAGSSCKKHESYDSIYIADEDEISSLSSTEFFADFEDSDIDGTLNKKRRKRKDPQRMKGYVRYVKTESVKEEVVSGSLSNNFENVEDLNILNDEHDIKNIKGQELCGKHETQNEEISLLSQSVGNTCVDSDDQSIDDMLDTKRYENFSPQRMKGYVRFVNEETLSDQVEQSLQTSAKNYNQLEDPHVDGTQDTEKPEPCGSQSMKGHVKYVIQEAVNEKVELSSQTSVENFNQLEDPQVNDIYDYTKDPNIINNVVTNDLQDIEGQKPYGKLETITKEVELSPQYLSDDFEDSEISNIDVIQVMEGQEACSPQPVNDCVIYDNQDTKKEEVEPEPCGSQPMKGHVKYVIQEAVNEKVELSLQTSVENFNQLEDPQVNDIYDYTEDPNIINNVVTNNLQDIEGQKPYGKLETITKEVELSPQYLSDDFEDSEISNIDVIQVIEGQEACSPQPMNDCVIYDNQDTKKEEVELLSQHSCANFEHIQDPNINDKHDTEGQEPCGSQLMDGRVRYITEDQDGNQDILFFELEEPLPTVRSCDCSKQTTCDCSKQTTCDISHDTDNLNGAKVGEPVLDSLELPLDEKVWEQESVNDSWRHLDLPFTPISKIETSEQESANGTYTIEESVGPAVKRCLVDYENTDYDSCEDLPLDTRSNTATTSSDDSIINKGQAKMNWIRTCVLRRYMSYGEYRRMLYALREFLVRNNKLDGKQGLRELPVVLTRDVTSLDFSEFMSYSPIDFVEFYEPYQKTMIDTGSTKKSLKKGYVHNLTYVEWYNNKVKHISKQRAHMMATRAMEEKKKRERARLLYEASQSSFAAWKKVKREAFVEKTRREKEKKAFITSLENASKVARAKAIAAWMKAKDAELNEKLQLKKWEDAMMREKDDKAKKLRAEANKFSFAVWKEKTKNTPKPQRGEIPTKKSASTQGRMSLRNKEPWVGPLDDDASEAKDKHKPAPRPRMSFWK